MTIAAIGVLVVMSLQVPDFRMGFIAAAVILSMISAAYLLWVRTGTVEKG